MSTTRVTVTPTELIVEPRGLDKLWSFRRRIVVPLSHVRGATHDPGMKHEPRGLRAPGLGLPQQARRHLPARRRTPLLEHHRLRQRRRHPPDRRILHQPRAVGRRPAPRRVRDQQRHLSPAHLTRSRLVVTVEVFEHLER